MFTIRKADKGRKYPGQRRSKKQEKEIANRIDGYTVSGSGSGRMKGDVRKPGIVRIEAKTTQYKSFSVTMDMITKIEDAALPFGEIPVLVVEFIDEKGNPIRSVCVVPDYVLDHLV